MSVPFWLRHAIIASSYISMAGGLTWLIWQIDDPLAPALAVVLGGFILLVGWSIHHALIRRRYQHHTQTELADSNHPQSNKPYPGTETESSEPARHARLRRAGFVPEDYDMTGEVIMMRNLVEQITGDRHAESWVTTVRQASDISAQENHPPLIPRPRPAILGGMPDSQILAILHEALRFDRFDLYIQPAFRLPARHIAFYECFCHIRDRDGNHLSPEHYAPIAENEGMIASIDNLLLIRTVQLARRALQKNQDFSFLCSLSGFTMADNRFLEDFLILMEDNARFATKIIFQFAQADIDALAGRLHRVTERLARCGYRFAMDRVQFLDIDYEGLGALNFRYVKLPVPLLLVHKQQAPVEEDLRLLRRTVDRYGINLVADQIESEEQVKDLIDYNIDFGQGSLLGVPQLAPGEIPAAYLPYGLANTSEISAALPDLSTSLPILKTEEKSLTSSASGETNAAPGLSPLHKI